VKKMKLCENDFFVVVAITFCFKHTHIMLLHVSQ
jgi:hypothetical protein